MKTTASEIRDVMTLLAQTITANKGKIDTKGLPYNNQRAIISRLFDEKRVQGQGQGLDLGQGQGYVQDHILLRLVVLNSYYSTNAAYSYFSLERLAERIIDETTQFAGKSGKLPNDYFYDIVLQNLGKPTTIGKDFFEASYGIQKIGTPGATLKSLISKYAYYCMMMDTKRYPLGFPIYDSLARESYHKVMKAMGLKPQMVKTLDEGSIGEYISALNELREVIFGKGSTALFCGLQQFDILDAYLWWMGKLEGGNFSLLLTENEYKMLINYVKPTLQDGMDINKHIADRLKNFGAAPFASIADPQRKKFLTAMIDHWRKL
ncbi:hypothetical protein [Porphyromonas sp.]|uniref:hypothetical protein n=1 Tax=Porphyromonas sp. TaxID=1924944 RepID=UPI0039957F56